MESSKRPISLSSGDPAGPRIFRLDDRAAGAIQRINNILSLTVVSQDKNELRAEYRAGFVQGKLQGGTILSARDNSWDNAYLTDAKHTFPAQPGPSREELRRAGELLLKNYEFFLGYVSEPSTGAEPARGLKRLLFRMVGIYHGATRAEPDEKGLDFGGRALPDRRYFRESELELGYESSSLSFLDVYFLNAYNDLMDVISTSPELCREGLRLGDFPDKCSAFLKRQGEEVILAHNSWMGFLSQTMSQTLVVNDDRHTENAATPGLIGSGTDFGYNGKGLLFTETTHRFSRTVARVEGLWIFWRAALAEQFAGSIDEFFDLISLDNTGTYLNGYMVVETNTRTSGLVEMSYRCFVYYRWNGHGYEVTHKCLDGKPCSDDYDEEMVTPSYLMGINYPASIQVRQDLQSDDNRPARREQFKRFLPAVETLEEGKDLITYTDDPVNPLSIFGRWDLGYGRSPAPKQVPDGSVDAKIAATDMVRAFMNLSGGFEPASSATGFQMLYGTPWIKGKPFIWSQSSWYWQKLRDVPDCLVGSFTSLPLFLR